MCGIAGFVDSTADPSLAHRRLEAMLAGIVHRGPDGQGTHYDAKDGLAMGMRRLSIIDLAGGDQPIWNEDQTVGVVFNGEIYNYVELAEELKRGGHQFRTHSDTEVLVHLYETMGTGMLERLRGMFAFAIYDVRNQTLFIARDHFGQKPLYYGFSSQGQFAFASEIKSLLVLPWIDRELSDQAFFDYISWHSTPSPGTHFKFISKLSPGSFLKIAIGAPAAPVPQRYWRYDLTRKPPIDDMNVAVTELDRVLSESLKLHLRADVPIGVLLSSGLDSRTIAAYAQDYQQGALQTFSVGFSDGDSELLGAAQTAKEIKSTHHSIVLTSSDFADLVELVGYHLDDPAADPAAFAVFKVCRLARDHVKVLLGGEGSDELFAGYSGRYQGMLQILERSDRMRHFGSLLPRPSAPYPLTRWGRLCKRSKMNRLTEMVSLRIEGFPGDPRHPRVLTTEQQRRLMRRCEQLAAELISPQRDTLSTMLTLDIAWQLPEYLLLKADKMSMAASIELRSPFLDIGVAATAASFASHLKLQPTGPGKLVLRNCLGRKIHENMDRPKMGFPVPLSQWLAGPLKSRVEQELFSGSAANSAWLDRTLLRQAWDDFTQGRFQGAQTFYGLWMYEVWHRSMQSIATVA